MRTVYIPLLLIPSVLGGMEITNRPTPPTPGWKYLFNCNITLGYHIQYGTGLRNTSRNVLPIQGGQFEGSDGLSGSMLLAK